MKFDKKIVAVALGLALLVGSASAEVIYSQPFDDPDVTGGNGNPLTEYGWQGHLGESGEAALLADGTYWGNHHPVTGQGLQLRVVDDQNNPPSGTNRIYSYMDEPHDYLAWTDAVSVDLSKATDLTLSWYEHSDASAAFRAAVRVDDGTDARWFASETLTAGTSGWSLLSADILNDSWIEFAFDGTQTSDAGASFGVDGTANGSLLPEGTLTGIGLYVETTGDDTSSRFDSVELNGTVIPEPATLALLGLGGLGILIRRR